MVREEELKSRSIEFFAPLRTSEGSRDLAGLFADQRSILLRDSGRSAISDQVPNEECSLIWVDL